jgi:hypothetical protein
MVVQPNVDDQNEAYIAESSDGFLHESFLPCDCGSDKPMIMDSAGISADMMLVLSGRQRDFQQ